MFSLFIPSILISSCIICRVYCDNSSTPCQLMERKGKSILAIGELSDCIMILSKDYQVLTLSKDALNHENHTFKLVGETFVPIEEKFPAFVGNDHFKRVKDKIFSGRMHHAKNADIIDLEVLQYVDEQAGVRYCITNNTFLPGRFYMNVEDYYFLLPKYDSNEFYGFTKLKNNRSTISYWREGTRNILRESWSYFCQKAGPVTSFYVTNKDEPCEVDVDWQDRRGFVANDNVYLFDDTSVTIFPESVISGIKEAHNALDFATQEPFTVSEKSYSKFFDCSANIIPKKKYIPPKNSLWLLLVLILLIITLVSCLCLSTMLIIKKRSTNKLSTEARSSLVPIIHQLTRLPSNISRRSAKSLKNPKNLDLVDRKLNAKTFRSKDITSENRKISALSVNSKNLLSNARSGGTIRSKLKAKSNMSIQK